VIMFCFHRNWLRRLVVLHKFKRLPVKIVFRMAYTCTCNVLSGMLNPSRTASKCVF